MSATEDTGISPGAMTELEGAARRAASAVRDPEIMRQACARMDRIREENRKRLGVQDIGVQIIRGMRDSR